MNYHKIYIHYYGKGIRFLQSWFMLFHILLHYFYYLHIYVYILNLLTHMLLKAYVSINKVSFVFLFF